MTPHLQDPAAQWPELLPPWPGVFVDAAGTRLYVRRAPATVTPAEPALFLHGLGGGGAGWTDLMALLRDRLDCRAIDLPGFGLSPPPADGSYDIAAQVSATVGLIESAGQGPVYLFGNSLGGTVATRVAAQRPDLVRALTLISPALPDLRPRLAPIQLLVPLIPKLGPALMRRAASSSAEELARQNLEALYGDPARLHPQRVQEMADEIRGAEGKPHMQAAYLGALRGVIASYLQRGREGGWRQAGRVRVPTLAIYGGADPFIDATVAARALRTFPRCRVLLLADVGHVAQLEVPEVVARAVRAHHLSEGTSHLSGG